MNCIHWMISTETADRWKEGLQMQHIFVYVDNRKRKFSSLGALSLVLVGGALFTVRQIFALSTQTHALSARKSCCHCVERTATSRDPDDGHCGHGEQGEGQRFCREGRNKNG